MPRIPEGNFRQTPSSRVGDISVPKIDSSASKSLAKLGGFLGDISKKVANAEVTVNSYDTVSKIDKDLQETLQNELEGAFSSSENGFIKDPTGKKVSLTEFVDNKVKEFSNSTTSKLPKNELSLALYNSTILPKIHKLQNKAKIIEAKQRTAFAADSKHNFIQNTIDEVLAKGSISEDDVAKVDGYINGFASVSGLQETAKDKAAFRMAISAKAEELLRQHGTSPEVVAQAKKLISLNPHKGSRDLLLTRLEKVRKDISRAEVNKRYADIATLEASIKGSPIDTALSTGKIDTLVSELSSRPIVSDNDNIAKRQNAIASLKATQVASALLLENGGEIPSKEEISKRISDVYRTLASKGAAIVDESTGKKVNILKGLKEKFVFEVYKKVNDFSLAVQKDPFESFRKINPTYAERMRSGSKEDQSIALGEYVRYAGKHGITSDNIPVVSRSEIESVSKFFKGLERSGDVDGSVGYSALKDLASQHGDLLPRVLFDVYRKGGRSINPSIFVAALSSSTEAQSILRDTSNYRAYLDTIKSKVVSEGDKFSKSSFEASIDASLPSEFRTLGAGSPMNSIISNGYRKALYARTAFFAKEGMSVSEATSKAIEELKHEVPVVQLDSNTSVILSKKGFKDHGVDIEKAGEALKNIYKSDQFAELLSNIDSDIIKQKIKAVPSLSDTLTFFSSIKAKSGEAKRIVAENFYETFKNNLRFYNDPTDLNSIRVELVDQYGHSIPLFVKKGGNAPTRGKLDAVKITEDYMRKNSKSSFGLSDLSLQSFGGFGGI